MPVKPVKTILLALIALLACAGPAAVGASASTGGAGAPSDSTPKTAPTAGAPATRKPGHKASLASWFGPGFYGNKTACGQTLTPVIVGVASRTLPCGTLVKIVYDGRQLTVPVLDRGPYTKGVNWDLTAGAAQALDITETVPIATRIVGHAANTPSLGVPANAPALEATGGASAGA
jgi:rare lipoprotein A (peptidoglycan hydrolase)